MLESLLPATPIAHSEPSSPQLARLARQDKYIAELVHSQSALKAEADKGRDTVKDLKTRWDIERKEWRRGCDTLQGMHHTAHLQSRIALTNERLSALSEKQRALLAQVGNAVRDHRLSRFQAREMELTRQTADLLDESKQDRERAVSRLDTCLQDCAAKEQELTRALTKSEQQRRQYADLITGLTRDKQIAETTLAHLRVQHSNLEEAHRATFLKLERASLEISSLQAHEKEWKSRAADWQSLEQKGEREFEQVRRRKTELESIVRDLEREIAGLKKKEIADSRTLEKEKKRASTLVDRLERLEELLASEQGKVIEAQREASAAHAEIAQAQEQVARVQQQMARVQAQFEASTLRPYSLKDDGADRQSSPTRKVRKAASKVPITRSELSSGEDPLSKPKTSSKVAVSAKQSNNPKKTTQRSQKTGSLPELPDAGITAVNTVALFENDSDEPEASSALPQAVRNEHEMDRQDGIEGQKRKKRRLFPPVIAQPFQWASTDTAGAIPNILSPIKSSAPAPSRRGNITLSGIRQ